MVMAQRVVVGCRWVSSFCLVIDTGGGDGSVNRRHGDGGGGVGWWEY